MARKVKSTPTITAFSYCTHTGFRQSTGILCSPPGTSSGFSRSCGTCADFETELAEFKGEANHVHLLVNFPPKVALSKLVNSLEGVSPRRMRQEFPDLHHHHYWRANRLWSGSYFGCSAGGAPPTVLRRYTEQQSRPV